MGPLHSSGSTKMDSSLESTLITLAQQILCVWGCICPEDSKRSSHSLRSKRLSLELTSVSLGVQTQGGNNIHKKKLSEIFTFQDKACAVWSNKKDNCNSNNNPAWHWRWFGVVGVWKREGCSWGGIYPEGTHSPPWGCLLWPLQSQGDG